jgi:hypothetical protein
MTDPKRHHWWPILQSKHWTGLDGLIHVTRADGSVFKANPTNIGLEGDLYTRYELTGGKDLTIERWFSEEIEGSFRETLDFVSSIPGYQRERLHLNQEGLKKRDETNEIGFIISDYRESIDLPATHRLSLAKYLSALLVRNPRYILKLQGYHERENKTWIKDNLEVVDIKKAIRNLALDNMLKLFDQYRETIFASDFMFIKRESANEFIYSDAGIVAKEPWGRNGIPFTIHAPLTPDLIVEVLPTPKRFFENRGFLTKVSNVGVKRFNRICIGGAERFVFTRSQPPVGFIKQNFGKPPPEAFAHGWRNGNLETIYDKSRDR